MRIRLARRYRFAFADDFGGHTLANLAEPPTVFQQGQVRMRMHVDEAGCQYRPFGLDDLFRLVVRQLADRGNPARAYTNIRVEPGSAATIDEPPAADQNIKWCSGSRLARSRSSACNLHQHQAEQRKHPVPGRAPAHRFEHGHSPVVFSVVLRYGGAVGQ